MDADVLKKFHNSYFRGNTWQRTHWQNIPTQKCPLDMWVYQELICKLRPDLIIETGTHLGGSALFMAQMLDLNDHGRLITVDTKVLDCPKHERISYLHGSSTRDDIVESITASANAVERVMVILDSDHSKQHVANELRLYAGLVKPVGMYLIVEDTNHAIVREGSDNHPGIAVREFLAGGAPFKVDPECEKFYMTFNPGGYLKRVK